MWNYTVLRAVPHTTAIPFAVNIHILLLCRHLRIFYCCADISDEPVFLHEQKILFSFCVGRRFNPASVRLPPSTLPPAFHSWTGGERGLKTYFRSKSKMRETIRNFERGAVGFARNSCLKCLKISKL